MSHTLNDHNHRNARSGFTLIELLVVVAVIAILISVLLPALNAARGAAQKIVGGNMHKQMGVGMITYASDNDQDIPGPNTSGARYLWSGFVPGQGFFDGDDELMGNTSGSTPVSTHDWISPTLGESLGFSPNRAERHADILNDWACPSAARPNDLVFGSSDDEDDFFDVLETEGFNQISFLSPEAFHLMPDGGPLTGGNWPNPFLPSSMTNRGQGNLLMASNLNRSYDLPLSYRPRFDKIRNTSNKVLITDGCRYLTDEQILDFDINASPNNFGSFLTSGPIVPDSFATAFRRDQGSGKSAESWKLSVRHNGNTAVNTTRFDGSVQTVNLESLYNDPFPWYPVGTELNDAVSDVSDNNSFPLEIQR